MVVGHPAFLLYVAKIFDLVRGAKEELEAASTQRRCCGVGEPMIHDLKTKGFFGF